ncbi:MAG: sulfatase [Planctomycetota bacterium]
MKKVLLALAILVVSAAGVLYWSGRGGSDQEPLEPPRKVCLFDWPGTLQTSASEGEVRDVSLPSFDRGWRVAGSLQNPLEAELADISRAFEDGDPTPWRSLQEVDGAIEVRDLGQMGYGAIRAPARRNVMRLSGRRGVVYTLVPIDPGEAYRFYGDAQARSLVPKEGQDFYGGTWYLAELSGDGEPEALLKDGLRPVLTARHQFEASATRDTAMTTFRASPKTRSLLIAAVLGMPGEVESGEAVFWHPRLEHLTEQMYREVRLHEMALPFESRFEGDREDWRRRRRIRYELGAETRPSIVMMPGESLTFEVQVPEELPELSFALGPWYSEEELGTSGSGIAEIRIGGELALTREVAPAELRLDARWMPMTLDLEHSAGDTLEIELRASSGPVVFGSPIIASKASAPEHPNVIVISIDTLRADHVGCYGYPKGTTPNLDALAAAGMRAEDVTSQAPYTLPSHVSMLSGQFPSVHGVQTAAVTISPGRTPLLAEILSRRGYVTRAFTAGGYLNAGFGFDRGFDAYSNVDPIRHRASPHFETFIARRPDLLSDAIVDEYGPERVADWIRTHKDEPFFLFVHSYEVHDFDPPQEYLDQYWQGPAPVEDFAPYLNHEYALEHGIEPEVLKYIVAHYDAALKHTDDVIGRWIALLEELGLSDDTIIAVTSDHGEELGERGVIAHSYTLYEEMIRVPLILKAPGTAPRVVTQPAMVVDLVPTILGRLGLEANPRMQGRDLLSGRSDSRFIWSEVDEIAHKVALRGSSDWKVIYGPEGGGTIFDNPKRWEVYDLRSDPAEARDRSGEDLDQPARLQKVLPNLEETLRALGAGFGKLGSGELDDKTKEQLRQLGYIK